MLGFRKKPDEQIKKDREKWLDEMIQQSARMEKFIKDKSFGWKEFTLLLDDYIEKVKKRKAITALDVADEKTIQQLKYLDHEIYILSWVKRIPEQFIGNVKAELEKQKEEDGESEV